MYLQYAAIALDRVAQLMGRVARQSAIYKNIDIVCYTAEENMLPRICLIDIDFMGYEEIARINLIQKVGIDKIMTWTRFDRFMLFARPAQKIYHYNDSRESKLTLEEIQEYMLM